MSSHIKSSEAFEFVTVATAPVSSAGLGSDASRKPGRERHIITSIGPAPSSRSAVWKLIESRPRIDRNFNLAKCVEKVLECWLIAEDHLAHTLVVST